MPVPVCWTTPGIVSSPVTVATQDAGELTFDVHIAGNPTDEPTVLALHGFPQSAIEYDTVAGKLRDAGFAFVAFDQRGYSPGARPLGTEHYVSDALVGDVVRILDALAIERVHLVGHDWGAHVAWCTTAAHPERVSTLTAISVPHPAAFARAFREDPDQREKSSYMGFFREAGRAESVLAADDFRRLDAMLQPLAGDRRRYYVDRLRQPAALTAALEWYRAMGRSDVGVIERTPTTYVWSDADIALGPTGARLCAEYVTAPYEFVTVPGVSHWVPEEAPDAVADAVVRRARSAG